MNFIKLKRILSTLQMKHLPRKKVDLIILSDLLESEIEDQEITRIVGIDLHDEHQIRHIISHHSYDCYRRLCLICESRKSLLAILFSVNLNKIIQNNILHSISYPGFLFAFSFIMMIFVNITLLPLFQSSLLFLGPKLDLSFYQFSIYLFIGIDSMIIFILITIIYYVRYKPTQLYNQLINVNQHNLWARLTIHQFCEKFIYFYKLGGSIDLILKQIQWSSGQVLNLRCHDVLKSLENGNSLTLAIKYIDNDLQAYFKMNEEGIDILKYLIHHTKVQEIMMVDQIKKYGRVLLAYSYLTILFMIVILYQIMLKPIEIMEELL